VSCCFLGNAWIEFIFVYDDWLNYNRCNLKTKGFIQFFLQNPFQNKYLQPCITKAKLFKFFENMSTLKVDHNDINFNIVVKETDVY
jgi:hypothetical protein